MITRTTVTQMVRSTLARIASSVSITIGRCAGLLDDHVGRTVFTNPLVDGLDGIARQRIDVPGAQIDGDQRQLLIFGDQQPGREGIGGRGFDASHIIRRGVAFQPRFQIANEFPDVGIIHAARLAGVDHDVSGAEREFLRETRP